MNKLDLCILIVSQLEVALNSASAAADQARETATDKQNIAENKYDTLGLEAAYLAHGQSERIVQLAKAVSDFKEVQSGIQLHDQVCVGSLVSLVDGSGLEKYVFVGPSAGGHMVSFEDKSITVITGDSPLGRSLLTLQVDDHIETEIAGKKTSYQISKLW